MSKFSSSPTGGSVSHSGATIPTVRNHEGAPAYERDTRTTLVNMAACCLVDERSFYGDTTGKVRQLIQWRARADPEWTLKLAVFLREELHLRSISQLILACAATVPETRPFIGRAFARVAVRPDDILEIAALMKDERHLIAKSLPASIRRAIGAGLNQLGETSFLKYRRARAFGLKHLLRLCHPRPATDRQSFLFRYVQDRRAWLALPEEVKKTCPAIAAWEAISRDGSRDPGLLAQAARAGLPWEILVPHFGATRRVWRQLVPHLPIMALLRNLSNLHRSGALSKQSVRTHVRSKLTDRALLRQSRLLPFRFLSAYKAMIERDAQVARWIEVGLEGSVENLPRLPGLTVVACDNSGSMSSGTISGHSSVTPREIASLLGAIAERICEESRVHVFAHTSLQVAPARERRLLARARQIAETYVGGATYAFKVLKSLQRERIVARRLLVFTDMQIYGESSRESQDEEFAQLLRAYRSTLSPELRTYIFNLQPYEHFMTPADEWGVSCFSGWSDNLLRYVEQDSGESGVSLVDQVDRVVL